MQTIYRNTPEFDPSQIIEEAITGPVYVHKTRTFMCEGDTTALSRDLISELIEGPNGVSANAFCILMYALAKPYNWQFTKSEKIWRGQTDHATRKALNELVSHGYAVPVKVGRKTEWHFYDYDTRNGFDDTKVTFEVEGEQ